MYSTEAATRRGTTETPERAAARWWATSRGWAIPFLVMGLAAVMRLLDITGKSLWLDEGFSVYVARLPLGAMIQTIIEHDTPPPLYYSLLHFWMAALGDSLFTARLLSAVLGVASVGMVYLLAMEAASRREAFAASLLMAMSPFQVWYGQEVRMYSLLGFLGVASAYLLLRALKRGTAAVWVTYSAVTGLALYTQISAAFLLAAEFIAAALYLLMWRQAYRSQEQTPRLRRAALLVLASQSAAVLVWLPWLPAFMRQGQTYQRFWIESPTPSSLVTTVLEFTSAYLPHWRVPSGLEMLVGMSLLLVLAGLVKLKRPEAIYLLAITVVPILALYLTSQVKPVFLSRALIYTAAPYLVLIAAGVAGMRRRQVGVLLLLVLLTLNVVSLYRLYLVEEKEEWNDAAAYVLAHSNPDDLVIFVASDAQLAFDYYADPRSTRLVRRGLPVDVFAVGPLEPKVERAHLQRMDEMVAGRSSFWLVQSHEEFADPDGLTLAHARASFRLLDSRAYEGITVLRFGAPAASGQAVPQSLISSSKIGR